MHGSLFRYHRTAVPGGVKLLRKRRGRGAVVGRAHANPVQVPPGAALRDAHLEALLVHLARQTLGVGAARKAAELHHERP